jgi:hypothetical protein
VPIDHHGRPALELALAIIAAYKMLPPHHKSIANHKAASAVTNYGRLGIDFPPCASDSPVLPELEPAFASNESRTRSTIQGK